MQVALERLIRRGAWRTTLPEGHRFEATQALRQVLNRAVAWRILDSNPAKAGVDNPRRQHPEKRPFESWMEINGLAGQLGPVHGPMIVFAGATFLRPSEWIALEWRDLDREARVVYVRRAFAHGRLQGTPVFGRSPCQIAGIELVPGDCHYLRQRSNRRRGRR